jgi:hypothetical protein
MIGEQIIEYKKTLLDVTHTSDQVISKFVALCELKMPFFILRDTDTTQGKHYRGSVVDCTGHFGF